MNRVYIARAEHYNIPGQHFSVHHSRTGACDAALSSLNIIRADIGMAGVRQFSRRAVKATQREVGRKRESNGAEECDVWIEPHWVKP